MTSDHREKIQGVMVLGLAALVLVLMKERKAAAPSKPGQTVIVETGGGGGYNPGGLNVVGGKVSASNVCPCYW